MLDVSIVVPVTSWCLASVDEFIEGSRGVEGGVSGGVCLEGSVVSESWYLCVSRARTIAAVLRTLWMASFLSISSRCSVSVIPQVLRIVWHSLRIVPALPIMNAWIWTVPHPASRRFCRNCSCCATASATRSCIRRSYVYLISIMSTVDCCRMFAGITSTSGVLLEIPRSLQTYSRGRSIIVISG